MIKVTYLKYKYYFPKIQQIIALLAQSVARMTLNHKVRGSSPLQGYLFFFHFLATFIVLSSYVRTP